MGIGKIFSWISNYILQHGMQLHIPKGLSKTHHHQRQSAWILSTTNCICLAITRYILNWKFLLKFTIFFMHLHHMFSEIQELYEKEKNQYFVGLTF